MPQPRANNRFGLPASGRELRKALAYTCLIAAGFIVGAPTVYFAITDGGAEYTARGSFWIEATPVQGATSETVARVQAASPWIELLRSRRVLESAETGRGVNAQDLVTLMDREGRVLHVALSSTEPEGVAEELDGLMERYVDLAAELKLSKLEESLVVMEEQLRSVELELAAAERDLERARVGMIDAPGTATSAAMVADEARLARRVRTTESLHDELRSRVEEQRRVRATAVPDVRIIDRATVSARSGTGLGTPIVLAILFACLAAIISGAFLLHGTVASERA